jgi:hypothetical protein
VLPRKFHVNQSELCFNKRRHAVSLEVTFRDSIICILFHFLAVDVPKFPRHAPIKELRTAISWRSEYMLAYQAGHYRDMKQRLLCLCV